MANQTYPESELDALMDHLAQKHDYRTPSGQKISDLRRIHMQPHRFPRNVPHRHTHVR